MTEKDEMILEFITHYYNECPDEPISDDILETIVQIVDDYFKLLDALGEYQVETYTKLFNGEM